MNRNKGFTTGELLISLFLMALLLSILTVWFIRNLPRETNGHASCRNNLKQMGLVFKMYASESEGGFYPPPMTLANKKGFIPIPSSHEIIPEYLTAPDILRCPKNKNTPQLPKWEVLQEQLHDEHMWKNFTRSYNYYGWMLDSDLKIGYYEFPLEDTSDDPMVTTAVSVNTLGLASLPRDLNGTEEVPAQMGAFYEAIFNVQESSETEESSLFTWKLTVAEGLGNGNGGTEIFRLREGIERFFLYSLSHPVGFQEKIQAQIPIMWDTPTFNRGDLPHKPGGLNVLYMDGHVEFIQYPSDRFPVTEGMAVWSRFNEALLFRE